MNTPILEPMNRLHTPPGTKVLALHCHGDRLFFGLSNGDLLIMCKSMETERDSTRPEARSVRSFRSFSEIKRLFQDNETSQCLVHEKTFANVLKTHAPITTINSLPLYEKNFRKVLLIGTSDVLQVYEWVGPHLNLVRSFDEIRAHSGYAFATIHRKHSKLADNSNTGDTHKKLLLVSSRKKLYVYKVVHRSKNIVDFELIREIILKERIRAISVFEMQKIALLATVQSMFSIDLADHEFPLNDVTSDPFSTHSFTPASSFLYFGLSNAGPHIAIIPLSDSKALFLRDTDIGVLLINSGADTNKSTKATWEETPVQVSAVPLNTCFLLPCYVLFTYAKTFDVVALESGDCVQSFKHLMGYGANFCSVDATTMTLAAGGDVFQFSVLPVPKQLELFLSMRGSSMQATKTPKDARTDLRLTGLERAITLISALDEKNAFFLAEYGDAVTSGLKQKQLFLRDLYKEKAVIYFEGYLRFHEALAELACEWMVAFNEMLTLFPDFLNGTLQINRIKQNLQTSEPLNLQINAIRRISEAEIQAYIDKSGNSVPLSEPETGKVEVPQKIATFHKAVQNLIVFLTDQRRVHLSFLNSAEEDPSIPWKSVDLSVSDLYPGVDKKVVHTKLAEYASAVDTSLFLCYYYTKPMLLGPLLRLLHNRCNARVVNECLLHKKSGLNAQDKLTFVSQLLDFYFGRSMHDEALRMLHNAVSSESGSEDGPAPSENLMRPLDALALSIRYMQRLPNTYLDLIFKHAYWILTENVGMAIDNASLLFMNDSFECEGYDRLRVLDFFTNIVKNDAVAIAYLEWHLHESGLLDTTTAKSTQKREIPKLSTRLCLLYLKQMSGSNDTGGTSEAFNETPAFQKMKKLLASGIEYEPWTVLKSIPTGEDKYLRLTVLVYYRLGEHQKSVDILYNQLGDLDAAMQYCAKVHDEPRAAETGAKLLFKLLEDLLMHYNENQDSIARLLTTQGDKMPTLQLLTALPDTFPLNKLVNFLKNTAENLDNRRFDTRMNSQLYKIGASKAHYELVMTQASYYSISDAAQRCPICRNPLGKSVTCVSSATDDIVHYACLDAAEKAAA